MVAGSEISVAIVTEHASARYGGEAAIPLHFYRVLKARGVPVWLVTHDRVRAELEEFYPGDPNIIYITDRAWLRATYQFGLRFPARVSYITTGFLIRLSTGFRQRRVVKQLVRKHGIDIVHQPTPVSPKEPSVMFGLGVPVIIGPMNGGMTYPPAFAKRQGGFEAWLLTAVRRQAGIVNYLLPGKRRAARLLVANRRTAGALQGVVDVPVQIIPENGVDLSLWRPQVGQRSSTRVEFVYLGRLIDWKYVDLLLRAFSAITDRVPVHLTIVGDGVERESLTQLARQLGLLTPGTESVTFKGWLDQPASARVLAAGDVLVLPSILECGGAVVLEAMALGKPVIATAWGGPLDYLDDSCGVLVPPTSAADLEHGFSEAMVRLASDGALRESLGAHGAEKVKREYDWDKKVDDVYAVYGEVLGRVPTDSLS